MGGETGVNAGSRRAAQIAVSDLEFELPEGLIAQHPPECRTGSRLMVVNDRQRESMGAEACLDTVFGELPGFLRAGDLLVFNDVRVIPARFFTRRSTGRLVEGLFLEEDGSRGWRVLLKRAGRCHVGERLEVLGMQGAWLRLDSHDGPGEWQVTLEPALALEAFLARVGYVPLPPYISRDQASVALESQEGPLNSERRRIETEDRERYQTVYARAGRAVAAPTAGLHFDEPLLKRLEEAGIERAFVTLHVGAGTFKPITSDVLTAHDMHEEGYELAEATCASIEACHRRGGRVIAVGTTSMRVLEGACDGDGHLSPGRGRTDIFIYPPYRFRIADGLLTNFHLPRSTLLALVMAFAGVEVIRSAYRHAVQSGYRFFSYGDAMLMFPECGRGKE